MKAAKIIVGLIGWALIGLLIVTVGAAMIVPKALGGQALTVLTGSMEPTLSPGDIVIIVPTAAEDIELGDTIAFLPYPNDPTLITHRVIEKQLGPAPTLRTQGDANPAPDDPIVAKQVVGKSIYRLPFLGYLTRNGPLNLPLLVAAGVLVAGGVTWSLWPRDS